MIYWKWVWFEWVVRRQKAGPVGAGLLPPHYPKFLLALTA